MEGARGSLKGSQTTSMYFVNYRYKMRIGLYYVHSVPPRKGMDWSFTIVPTINIRRNDFYPNEKRYIISLIWLMFAIGITITK